MPRPPMPHRAALGLALLLAAAPASAAIVIDGSVRPAPPPGFGVPDPNLVLIDADNDNIVDWLEPGGNEIFTNLINPDDPTDANGGAGVAWNDADVWRDYDTTQHILVGDAGQSGTLTINGGSALRYQHLVLGGVSEGIQGSTTQLDFDPTDSPNTFTVLTALTAAPGSGGNGTLVVTGAGSVFNNDPNMIPGGLQTALNLANGDPIYDFVADLENAMAGTTGTSGFELTTREQDVGFDAMVGVTGYGRLQADTGGRIEIQDALMAGIDQVSYGEVIIDGFGSYLVANGRSRLRDNGAVTPTLIESVSFIGGGGTGVMSLSNGGRADFRNGLSVGAPGAGVVPRTGDGSGTVTLTGSSTSMTAYASRVGGFAFDGQTLALAVGELNVGSLATPIDPSAADVQPGTLTISAGATVTTSFSSAYGTSELDSNMAIGRSGEVILNDGKLIVANDLLSDGAINGYGTVRANSLDTSVYSVIRGGDDAAQNPALGEPLRLILNGNVGATNTFDSFINRGLVAGIVEIDAAGEVNNQGRIEAGGEIFARSITTTATSRIVGGASGRSLEIRLDHNGQVSTLADANAGTFPAFENLGSFKGDVNLITGGGVSNGADRSTTNAGTNGGTIDINGTITAGTFLNQRNGLVRVSPGKSLSIYADGVNGPVQYVRAGQAAIVEDGAEPTAVNVNSIPDTASFYQANLGTILVDNGSLEVGLLGSTDNDSELHVEMFRNARYIDPSGAAPTNTSLGTITSNGGDINFRTGLYNTGVVAFTGGDNVVTGRVINAGIIDYDSNLVTLGDQFPGVIVVSGEGTSVTFQDNVTNEGLISVGPFDSVANFLGDYTGAGAIQIAVDASSGASRGAYLDVAGNVAINAGAIVVNFINQAPVFDPGLSLALITAGDLSPDSLFTELTLPDLPDGKYWDVVYDTVNDEVRLEMVMSDAFGADFTGDGIVNQSDVDVWIRNAGITMGASVIQGDADLDGDVDLADYDVLMTQLAAGVPSLVGGAFAAVPEPTTAMLLCLAASAALRRRV